MKGNANRMSTFNENIYSDKRFIYQIGEKYYVIGENTFAELSDPVKTDIFELLQNSMKKNNDRQMEKYLEKMIRVTNQYRTDSKEYMRTREKLFSFLDELSQKDETAYLNLQNQYMKYVELYQRYHNEDIAPN